MSKTAYTHHTLQMQLFVKDISIVLELVRRFLKVIFF